MNIQHYKIPFFKKVKKHTMRCQLKESLYRTLEILAAIWMKGKDDNSNDECYNIKNKLWLYVHNVSKKCL
jgi:hypothetical protein